jgi:hypothetical protein
MTICISRVAVKGNPQEQKYAMREAEWFERSREHVKAFLEWLKANGYIHYQEPTP